MDKNKINWIEKMYIRFAMYFKSQKHCMKCYEDLIICALFTLKYSLHRSQGEYMLCFFFQWSCNWWFIVVVSAFLASTIFLHDRWLSAWFSLNAPIKRTAALACIRSSLQFSALSFTWCSRMCLDAVCYRRSLSFLAAFILYCLSFKLQSNLPHTACWISKCFFFCNMLFVNTIHSSFSMQVSFSYVMNWNYASILIIMNNIA